MAIYASYRPSLMVASSTSTGSGIKNYSSSPWSQFVLILSPQAKLDSTVLVADAGSLVATDTAPAVSAKLDSTIPVADDAAPVISAPAELVSSIQSLQSHNKNPWLPLGARSKMLARALAFTLNPRLRVLSSTPWSFVNNNRRKRSWLQLSSPCALKLTNRYNILSNLDYLRWQEIFIPLHPLSCHPTMLRSLRPVICEMVVQPNPLVTNLPLPLDVSCWRRQCSVTLEVIPVLSWQGFPLTDLMSPCHHITCLPRHTALHIYYYQLLVPSSLQQQ